jgi:hypothetical protein
MKSKLMKSAPSWLPIAMRPDIVNRSYKIALIVGTILAILNHGDKLLLLQLAYLDIGKILLTYAVPYCVSTYSSVKNEQHQFNKALK